MTVGTRVAYFLTLFPKVSETFILNEVVGLRSRGIDVLPLCLDSSTRLEPTRHSKAAEIQGVVEYLKDGFPWRHAASMAILACSMPFRLSRFLFKLFMHPAPNGESRTGRCILGARALYLAKRSEVDHIHSHWSYPGDVALFTAEALRVPFSFTAHAHDIFEDAIRYDQAGFEFAERVRRSAFVVACTKANAAFLRSSLPNDLPDRVHAIYHGLDLNFFRRREWRPLRSPINLISVGRFVPYKGFDVVTRAVSLLLESGVDASCKLVGPKGSQTEPIARLIHDLDLEEAVTIEGPKSQEQLRDLYAQSDVFINSSNPEGEYGVANVIVEAMASGLPVVATRRTQSVEYLHDAVNCLLVDFGDPQELAGAVKRLINEQEFARELSSRARADVEEEFSLDRSLDKLQSLFVSQTG